MGIEDRLVQSVGAGRGGSWAVRSGLVGANYSTENG